MDRHKKPSNYWNFEMCKKVSFLVKNKKEFLKKFSGAYHASKKNNWLDEICIHMKKRQTNPRGYWTKEKCQEEALKYTMRSIFQVKSTSAYQTAINNNWLDEICAHMIICRSTKWTKEKCQQEALKYKSRSEFRVKSPSAHERSRKEGWLNQLIYS